MEQYDERTWFCPRTGDQVSLTYIDLVPDLPAPLDELQLLRHRLALETAEVGALIEAHVVTIDSVPTLYQLLKLPIPNQDSGQAFIAAFTVPKATCSAVLRIQCAEGSPTGVRESAVIAQVGPEAFVRPHPYAPALEGRLPWHAGDEERWDGRFPDHPLARARAWAKKTIDTARVDPAFGRLPPFVPGGPGPNDHTDFHQPVERPALPPASAPANGYRQDTGAHARPDQAIDVPDLRAPELEEATKQINGRPPPAPPPPDSRPLDSPPPGSSPRRSKLDSASAWQIPPADPDPSPLSSSSETIGARASRTRRPTPDRAADDLKVPPLESPRPRATTPDSPASPLTSRSGRTGSHRLPSVPERPDSPGGRVVPLRDRSPDALDSPSGRHGSSAADPQNSGPLSRPAGTSSADPAGPVSRPAAAGSATSGPLRRQPGDARHSADPMDSGPLSRPPDMPAGSSTSGPLPRPAADSPSGPASRPSGPAPADPLAAPFGASSSGPSPGPGDPLGSPIGSTPLRRSPDEPPATPGGSSGPLPRQSAPGDPLGPPGGSTPPRPVGASPADDLTSPALGRPALGPGASLDGSVAASRIVLPHTDYPTPHAAGTFPAEPGFGTDAASNRRVMPPDGYPDAYPDSPTLRALPGYSNSPSGTFSAISPGGFPGAGRRPGAGEESTDIRPTGFPNPADYPGGRVPTPALPPATDLTGGHPISPPSGAFPVPPASPSPNGAYPNGFPGTSPTSSSTRLPPANPAGYPNGSPTANPSGFPNATRAQLPPANPGGYPNGSATASSTQLPPANPGYPNGALSANPSGFPNASSTQLPPANPGGFPNGSPTASSAQLPPANPGGYPNGSAPGFPNGSPVSSNAQLPPVDAFPGVSPDSNMAELPPSRPGAFPGVSPASSSMQLPPANGRPDPMANPNNRSGTFAPAAPGNGNGRPAGAGRPELPTTPADAFPGYSPHSASARVAPPGPVPAAPPSPVGRPMAPGTVYPSPSADPIGSPQAVGLPPGGPQSPGGAGNVMHTVLIGLPIGGYLPLWHNESVSYWRMADPAGIRSRLGVGVESRAEIDNRRFREAALFAPDGNKLFLLDRHRNGSGNLGGASTQLIPASEDEAYRAADDKAMSDLYGWIGDVVLAAGQRGEYVAIETGGWNVPVTPVVLIMLRTDGREWHSVVETSPVPHGAPVWRDQQPVDGDTQLLASPATDRTMRAAGLLTRFAVATWPMHPFQLGLSFGPNPTLGDGGTR
jgi:hypothetical protein